MDFKLTQDMIRQILRMSEGAVSPIKGKVRGVVVDKIAHAGERHTGITNDNLARREAGNNQIELFTAFLDFKQAVEVAEIILNLPDVAPELERLYYSVEGKSGHARDSGVSVITRNIHTPIRVRYKGGGGILQTSMFTMVLHKKVGFPCNFMVFTFYPTLPL